jgi:hypothetical protein
MSPFPPAFVAIGNSFFVHPPSASAFLSDFDDVFITIIRCNDIGKDEMLDCFPIVGIDDGKTVDEISFITLVLFQCLSGGPSKMGDNLIYNH